MKAMSPRTIKLDIASRFDMIEMVHTVLARAAEIAGFDEDAAHYLSVAVRESLVNAIKHGNKGDESKRVLVQLTSHASALEVRVQDQGPGFDPGSVPDPLAQENLLKADGRGIFFMRQFMDEVSYSFPPRGGTVVKMVKRIDDHKR
jgi:serine/threonine-protein kinase RsbW